MKFSLRITKILSAAILAVLVGGVVFPAGVAFAQAPADPYKGYGIFGTLFQKDDSGNLSRINTVAPTAITGGAGFGAIGISAFKVAVDLTMDESRERGTNGQDQDFVRK